ncbi:hypothetical protein [Paenibacillus cremeus]|uniref:Uncharacterized protein n=1 Tax=Paenibacillus cremeus TaxID=2163881 RepID=A0A559JHN1_9BACL|nr:hypothetical protein [Paenibacillus cremeus]TVX99380.1 hypothetical protein FPZ49_33945 [Paenibacillus cremeus]
MRPVSSRVPLSLKDQGMIVANVRTSNIYSMIEEVTDSQMSNVQLLDADSRPFFDKNTTFLSADSMQKERSGSSASYEARAWLRGNGFAAKRVEKSRIWMCRGTTCKGVSLSKGRSLQ